MENPKPFQEGTDTGLAYNPIFGRSKDISLISICPCHDPIPEFMTGT